MPRVSSIAACLALALVLPGCKWLEGTLQDKRDEKPGIQLSTLTPPAGMSVTVFAQGLPKARHMAMGERTLFVGSMAGNVYAIPMNGNPASGSGRVILQGLTDPSGVAFANGTLYVADRTRILRYEGIESRLDNPPAPITTLDGLPDKSRHDAHAMAIGPDGKLYVSIGSPCNVCESDGVFGTIVRVNLDGSGKEVVAKGIRNSVGFDFHPRTRELWFTDNGQDDLGPDRPNDELNRVTRMGEDFGFPYCHDRDIADPKFGGQRKCSEFTPPAFGLGAHVAALGMRFDRDGSIIVARHGSHPPTRVAYDVQRVVFDGDKPARMEPFLAGFLQGTTYWGRPVDVLPLRDGSVLVSDDLNGAIYRVSRKG